MQGTKVREEKTRLFKTLYKGKMMLVKKTVWFLDGGAEKHELTLSNRAGNIFYKRWVWMTNG